MEGRNGTVCVKHGEGQVKAEGQESGSLTSICCSNSAAEGPFSIDPNHDCSMSCHIASQQSLRLEVFIVESAQKIINLNGWDECMLVYFIGTA